jgi:hypothetical protein
MAGVTSLARGIPRAFENKKAGRLNIEGYFGNPAVSERS